MPILYTSQYPPLHNATYVKATTFLDDDDQYFPWFTTDPALSLIGGRQFKCWLGYPKTFNRFHIDLGSSKTIRRIYYENHHHSGALTEDGVKDFTFWGSNTGPGVFDDLVYVNDEGWIGLTIAQNTLDEHVGLDQADPKYILVTNTTAYRYYAFKFPNNYGGINFTGVRHIALQTEDDWPPPPPEKDASRTGIYAFKTLKI